MPLKYVKIHFLKLRISQIKLILSLINLPPQNLMANQIVFTYTKIVKQLYKVLKIIKIINII